MAASIPRYVFVNGTGSSTHGEEINEKVRQGYYVFSVSAVQSVTPNANADTVIVLMEKKGS
jgi:hypothetical protein